MNIRLSAPTIIFLLSALFLPLVAQTDFEYALSKHKGNKIVLLGEWGAAEMGKWRATLDAAGVFEHGFALLSRSSMAASSDALWNSKFGIRPSDVGRFESWLHQRFNLSRGARWAAISMEGGLIGLFARKPRPQRCHGRPA